MADGQDINGWETTSERGRRGLRGLTRDWATPRDSFRQVAWAQTTQSTKRTTGKRREQALSQRGNTQNKQTEENTRCRSSQVQGTCPCTLHKMCPTPYNHNSYKYAVRVICRGIATDRLTTKSNIVTGQGGGLGQTNTVVALGRLGRLGGAAERTVLSKRASVKTCKLASLQA